MSLLDGLDEGTIGQNRWNITLLDLVGPQGSTGTQGAPGATGATGPQGAAGSAGGLFLQQEDFTGTYSGSGSQTVYNFSAALTPVTLPTSVSPSQLTLYPLSTGASAGNRTILTGGVYYQPPAAPVNGVYGVLSNYTGPTAATYDGWALGRSNYISSPTLKYGLTFSPASLLPDGEARFSCQFGWSNGGFGGLGGTASTFTGSMSRDTYSGLCLFSDVIPTSADLSPAAGGTGTYVNCGTNSAQIIIYKDASSNVYLTFSQTDDAGAPFWSNVNVYENPATVEANADAWYTLEIKMNPTDVTFTCYSAATTILFTTSQPLYPGSDLTNWTGFFVKGMGKSLASRADNVVLDYFNYTRQDSSTSSRGLYF